MRKTKRHCRKDVHPPLNELQALLDALVDLPPEHRVREALSLSSKLVEFAAFEGAAVLSSARVGEMINWAAALDRQGDGLQSQDSDVRPELSDILH